VVRTRNTVGFIESEAIAFKRIDDGSIAVELRSPKKTHVMFRAKPHVNIKGECMFEVDEVPHQPWQISKRALEDTFFWSMVFNKYLVPTHV
jgi:hypothetical protein